MRWRLLLIAVLGLLLLVLQHRLWNGTGGQRDVQRLQQQVQQQQHTNTGLQQRNAALAAEVKDLKSGEAAIEERARDEFGLIKPGETFYRVVDDRRPAEPAPSEAPEE